MIILSLILIIFFLIVGILLITNGSKWMTDSMFPVAKKLGTSYIAVASIVVSLMVTMPNIFVAFYAAILGHTGISIGVIIGSVICNTCLTPGISAILKPLSVSNRVIVRDGIFFIIITVIVFLFGSDLNFDRVEGGVLLLLLVPYLMGIWFFERSSQSKHHKEGLKEMSHRLDYFGKFQKWFLPKEPGIILFLIGTAVLLIGSYIFSESLIRLGNLAGISDVLLGLTIGSIGPTVPNIAAGIQGTLKKYTSIAIAETFSANIITLLVILGILSAFAPVSIIPKWFYFDMPAMIATSALLMFFILKSRFMHEKAVLRFEGVLLLLAYIIFLLINIYFF